MGNICSCLLSNYYLAYYNQNNNDNKEQIYVKTNDIRKRKIVDSHNISKQCNKNRGDSYVINNSNDIKSNQSYDNIYTPNYLPKYKNNKSVDNLYLIDPISPLSRHSSSMRKSKSLDYLIQLLNV